MAQNLLVSNAASSQAQVLDDLLKNYSPTVTKRDDLDSLGKLSATLTGESFYFAVDPPISKIQEITQSIINSVAAIFLFFHVSEKWCYNDYGDIRRPSSPSSELTFSSTLQFHRKTDSEIHEYLSALARLTDALCRKVDQWEHFFLVLPLEACAKFGSQLITGTGKINPRSLTTFCLGITPPFLVPSSGARYSTSTADDLASIRDVLVAVLEAPETKRTLKNLFFEFMPSREMLRRQLSRLDASGGPALVDRTLQVSWLPVPLNHLSTHCLEYVQISSPSSPVNIYHFLQLAKDNIQHLVITVSHGPLISDHGEEQETIVLPNLKILKITLLQSTGDDDLGTALSLLNALRLPAIKRMTVICLPPLFDNTLTQAVDAVDIQRCLNASVTGVRAECSLMVEHFSETVTNNLRQLLTGWSQVEVNSLP